MECVNSLSERERERELTTASKTATYLLLIYYLLNKILYYTVFLRNYVGRN